MVPVCYSNHTTYMALWKGFVGSRCEGLWVLSIHCYDEAARLIAVLFTQQSLPCSIPACFHITIQLQLHQL